MSSSSIKVWIKEAKEIEEFHRKRQEKAGVAVKGRPRTMTGKLGWSINDTAKWYGLSYTTTAEMIRLGEWLRKRPEITTLSKAEVLRMIDESSL